MNTPVVVAKHLMGGVVILLTFAIASTGCQGEHNQQCLEWSKAFGGDWIDHGVSIIESPDGGYVVAGTMQVEPGVDHAWLLKVDTQGNLLWSDDLERPGWSGHAVSVCSSGDGGYVIGGWSSNQRGEHFSWVRRLDGERNEQWTKEFRESLTYIRCVQQTADGGYAAVGYRRETDWSDTDFWLVKLDGAGQEEWTKTYGGPEGNRASWIEQTSDGGYAIVGYRGADAWLVKVDGFGEVEWTATYGGEASDVAQSVRQMPDGGYILGVVKGSSSQMYDQACLVKLDSQGNVQWSKIISDDDIDIESLQVTSDGGLVSTGYLRSPERKWSSLWVAKTDGQGEVEWTRQLDGDGLAYGEDVLQTAEGDYIVVGATGTYLGDTDLWIVKLSSACE